MIKPSVQDLIYRKTIPHPKQSDPPSFYAHVQKNLVPEVRQEVQTFYGSLDCDEARYPGLDYTFAPHRRRLSRYTWHRRLFRTFDELRLTEGEILSLCQWEGTRSAKERYEAETKTKIKDTTADDVVAAPQGHGPRARIYWSEETTAPQAAGSSGSAMAAAISNAAMKQKEGSDEADAELLTEDTYWQDFSNLGPENDTIHATQAISDSHALAQQQSRQEMEAQWEQWMKEAMERSQLDRDTVIAAMRNRQTFDLESPAIESGATSTVAGPSDTPAMTQPQFAARYNHLRTMLSDLQSVNDHLSAENAALTMYLNRNQPETAR